MPSRSNRACCHEPHASKTPRARRADSVIQRSSSSSSSTPSTLDGISDNDIDNDNGGSSVVWDPATPTPAARRIASTNTTRTDTGANRRDAPQVPNHGSGAFATPATQRDTPQAPDPDHDGSRASAFPSASSSPSYTFGLADIDAAVPSPPRQRRIPHTRSPPPERKRWLNHNDRYDWFEEEDRQRVLCINPQEVLHNIQDDVGAMDAERVQGERTGKAGDALVRQRTRARVMRMIEGGAWIPPPEVRDGARPIEISQETLAQLQLQPEMQWDALVYWRSSSTLVLQRRFEVFQAAPAVLYRIELRDHPVFGRRIIFYFPIGHAHTYDATDGYKNCDKCTEAGLEEATRVATLALQRRLVGRNVCEIFCAEPVAVDEPVQERAE